MLLLHRHRPRPAAQTATGRGGSSGPRPALLGLLLAALGGCSVVGTAYKNADHMMLDRLERFVELEPEQRAALGAALEAGLVRHQREELPVLVGRLRETRALVAGGLDHDGADRLMALGRDLYRETASSLIDDISPVLATLDASQIDELEKRMAAERDRVREERLGDGLAARAEQRGARTVKAIERWTGRLDDAQRALVRHVTARVPSRTEAWLRFSAGQERLLLAALRDGAGADALARRLHAWWIDDAERDEDFRRRSADALELWAELIVRLDATLTPGQRHKMVKKLDRYTRVFDDLARKAITS